MLEVLNLTLSRLSLSSDCGMLAEARRLCDEDGGGGLRPRDVDMVADQVLNSFSRVGGIAGKQKTEVAWSRGRVRDVFSRMTRR